LAAGSRLERADFTRVARRDLDLAPRFASVDAYMALLVALRREAERRAAGDGSLTLG